MSDLKRMAGINTAVTAVGTVSGGVALGTGIAKANTDKKAYQLEAELQEEINRLNQLAATQTHIDIVPDFDVTTKTTVSDISSASTTNSIESKKRELAHLTQKSKTLGNIRTGTLAGTAVADSAGTIIAANNRIKADFQSRIDECRASVSELSRVYMQARLSGSETLQQGTAKNIIQKCGEYETLDLTKINKRATGAAVSAGVGATMALVGTITSASANSDKIRNDNSTAGKQKEKNLNTASNVMAGGSTLASGAATVFNATQIKAIKHAIEVADKCEWALNQ